MRDEYLALMLQCARLGKLMGYRFKVEGWTLLLVRPDGSVAMTAKARNPEQLAEIQAMVLANA